MFSIDINSSRSLGYSRTFVCILLHWISGFATESGSAGRYIYAAHYARRGYCRGSLSGYGRFLDYQFGRTNYCDNTAFVVIEGTNKFLCVTNTIGHISKNFDSAALYHDAKTRRLFRIAAARVFPESMGIVDRIKFLNPISRDFDYRYRIKVPVPSSIDIDALAKKRQREWSVARGYDSFLITLALSLASNDSMFVTMTVESKQVRHPLKRRPIDAKDVEVDVSDL